MLDNVADLLLAVGLLHGVFEFPAVFALRHMAPGTAIGVLVGDLLFFFMAIRLARRLGRPDVTAMPLGLDTPSTFGMVFFVLGPAFLSAKARLGGDPADPAVIEQAAVYTWHIGVCCIVWSGLFKLATSLGSGWVRRVFPRASLLGSLAAVALVLISFLPLLEVLHYPVAGMAALAVILTTLVARVKLPFRLPGALGALLVGGGIYYAMQGLQWLRPEWGLLPPSEGPGLDPSLALLPTDWLTIFRFEWLGAMQDSLQYLPIVIPFALATVVGGIDCTESAAAAGDEFPTGRVIAVEAVATLAAGLCGGVIQTTPYIGHPAYKAMGGRAAYTLATALFIGSAGLLGYFGYIYAIVPKAAVFPILIFIGLEITAQSFHATPGRHYAAVVLACVPALAALVLIFTDDLQGQYFGAVGKLRGETAAIRELAERADDPELGPKLKAAAERLERETETLTHMAGDPAAGRLGEPLGMLGKNLQTVRMLAGGFIVTSLLWAAILAAIIDRRFGTAALCCLVAAGCAAVGVIHSPLPGSPLVNPFDLPANLPHHALGQTPLVLAAAYLVTAGLLAAWGAWARGLGVARLKEG